MTFGKIVLCIDRWSVTSDMTSYFQDGSRDVIPHPSISHCCICGKQHQFLIHSTFLLHAVYYTGICIIFFLQYFDAERQQGHLAWKILLGKSDKVLR